MFRLISSLIRRFFPHGMIPYNVADKMLNWLFAAFIFLVMLGVCLALGSCRAQEHNSSSFEDTSSAASSSSMNSFYHRFFSLNSADSASCDSAIYEHVMIRSPTDSVSSLPYLHKVKIYGFRSGSSRSTAVSDSAFSVSKDSLTITKSQYMDVAVSKTSNPYKTHLLVSILAAIAIVIIGICFVVRFMGNG